MKYVFYCLMCLFIFNNESRAAENSVSYEKFYRLNAPAYRSNSGDLFNFNYETNQANPGLKFDYFGMGDLRLYFQDNYSINYSLQEAYFQYLGDSFTVDIGRKILDWNENEKYWGLGYLNASQAFNLLGTEEEGVTGVNISKTLGQFEFDFLFSYLFIPQVNPAVDFKNGEVRSKSDWVRLPPKKTVLNNLEVPIYYKVADYQISKIIFQKSLGGNIRYDWGKGGISFFAIYKPENKLRINANAYYDNIILKKVVVEADPAVNHHAYYGAQVYESFGDLKVRGGVSFVDPNARFGKDVPIYNSEERKTFKSEFFTINPRYEREACVHMSANVDRKSYVLSLNYIHLLSHHVRASDDFYTDTIKWERALGGSVSIFINDSLKLFFDIKYDFSHYDNIVKSEISYSFKNQMHITLGLEILKAPTENSYWSYYRANDVLYSSVGMSY